ncbi:MAG: MCE family protein [Nocardioidaceae bacterium]|nr:MCE family protein [Nocardioidaceae bacterium]
MGRVLDRLSGRVLAVLVAALLLAATFFVFLGGGETRHVTAHFSRAVAIYPGSELRLMGVRIGQVDAVVPEGDSVRVEMSYDASYELPADAKAAIVTPTLVADRFVQIGPAFEPGDRRLADDADIPLAKTGSPVELDRIYKSLADLSTALGPNGANRNGALSSVLSAGANALRGQGALANRTLLSMSRAVQTFGDNSGALFSSVRQLSELTEVLASNDAFVNQFMGDLAGVSAQLVGERGDLRTALAALARVVDTVRTFVHDNKAALTSNVRDLSSVLGTLAKEKDALGTALQLGALGLSNLTLAYDVKTGTIGSRVQLGPTGQSLGNVLCDVVVNAKIANAGLACQVLKKITAPLSGSTNIGAGVQNDAPKLGSQVPATTIGGLLGGGR